MMRPLSGSGGPRGRGVWGRRRTLPQCTSRAFSNWKKERSHWYLKAAEQGNASGEYALALMYRDGDGVGQNHAEAARWFRKAASHGQPDAARNLAEAYRKGLGVPRDEAAAQKWQRKFDENFSQLLRRH